MKNKFQPLDSELVQDNIFKLIGKEWMLITAGTINYYNTMTASWGGMGILWGRKIVFCVIRPQRYTFQFMQETPQFSLSFFDEAYRSALDFCGSHSGRNYADKAAAAGLTAIETLPGIVSFTEARMVFECKKLYFQDLDPDHFIDPTIGDVYPAKDYHRMYVGEVLRCLTKSDDCID
jgi:flavin reductase (DIM6/NTAB) family NADH-FMN oxidoreductase RutF